MSLIKSLLYIVLHLGGLQTANQDRRLPIQEWGEGQRRCSLDERLFHGSQNVTLFRFIRPCLVLHDCPPRFLITFDMSPDIEGNIYFLIPKVNNYELRP
jgi:hypothetical protein